MQHWDRSAMQLDLDGSTWARPLAAAPHAGAPDRMRLAAMRSAQLQDVWLRLIRRKLRLPALQR